MFQNITTSYSNTDASIEIIIMLLGAFILGWILAKCMSPRPKEQGDTYISAKSVVSSDTSEDDLQLIEGIGPAIEKLLFKYGVRSYKDMIDEGVEGLEEVLESGGSKFTMHNPSTWPDQAKLAHEGKWSELEEYQEILKGGVKKK